MFIRINTENFSFQQKIEPEEDWYEDYKNYWLNAVQLDCEINDVPTNHPAYGCLETHFQSDYAIYQIDWTHIKFFI